MKVSLTNISWKNPGVHKIWRFISKFLEVQKSPSRGLWPKRRNFCPDQRQHYHQHFDIHPKESICKPNQESAYKAAKVSITLASAPRIFVKFTVHTLTYIINLIIYIHLYNLNYYIHLSNLY